MADAVARAWLTGTPEEPIINLDLPAGPKGEPGGWNVGTSLAASDLDTITTPGLYYQSGTSNVNPDKHYPPMTDVNGSVRGVLEVMSWGGSNGTIMQRYTNIGTGISGAQRPRTTYTRVWHTGLVWSAWSMTAPDQITTDTQGFKSVDAWDASSNTWVPVGGPGGWTQGSELGTNDLNAITTPGLYRQTSSPTITLARNYPEAGRVGVLSVEARIAAGSEYGPSVVQTYTPFFGTPASESRMFFKRTLTGMVWQPWRVFTSQRIDNTVGKAVYTWDDTAQREQLVYGDTGWRDVTNNLSSDFTCTKVTIRRSDYMVTVNYDSVKSTTETGHVIWIVPPAGFKPDLISGLGNHRYGVGTDLNGNNLKVVSPESQSLGIRFLSYTTGLSLNGSFTYYTRDPWPTTYPGTTVGTVPNV